MLFEVKKLELVSVVADIKSIGWKVDTKVIHVCGMCNKREATVHSLCAACYREIENEMD